MPKGKRGLIIAACVFLGAVLLFGGVLGTVALVRSARAVVSYRGVTLDEGCVNYLAATYKNVFLRENKLGERVSEALWEEPSDPNPNLTWGELLARNTESYVRSVTVRAYLFDRAEGLNNEDKKKIEEMREEVLSRAGSVADFNALGEPMGFTYSDYKEAMELIYKANRTLAAIYGDGGGALSSESYYGVCNEYFDEAYTRVKILFIRTETEFRVDEDGNRVVGSDGKDELRELSSGEKEKRLQDINDIRAAIDALLTGADEQMSPEYFSGFLGKYGYYPEYADSGFYLSSRSSYTRELASAEGGLLPVVEEALTMSEGEYGEVECDFGVCFIYKYAPDLDAYKSTSLESWFRDFYADASEYMFVESVSALIADAKVSDKLAELDIVAVPKNTDLVPRFE